MRPRNLVEHLIRDATTQMKVRGGPFAGLRYTNAGSGLLMSKLMGTYESELRPIIESVLQTPGRRFVNVGAGEGWYAVGFALFSKAPEVIAYEASDEARSMLEQMAAANGVKPKIELKGLCTPEALEDELAGKQCFLMIDVEGAEDQLLDPVKVPALKSTAILFESHDILDPGVGGRVVRRFLDTHEILEIGARYRQPTDITFLPQWYVRYIRYELFRHLYERPDKPERMRWFYMVPKQ
jgi:hypothetical protein